MAAKMKTLEEQHQVKFIGKHSLIFMNKYHKLQDYQRHIAVLKESLCAKEEHYNMLQSDVSIVEPGPKGRQPNYPFSNPFVWT